jgi:basic membrane protein A
MAISSCSRVEQEEIVATRQLHVLLLPHELGDMGYGDAVLRGVQTIRRDYEELEMRIYQPESMEEGEEIFRAWAEKNNHKQSELFIITAEDYEYMLVEYFMDNDLSSGKEILLFESKNFFDLPIYTFSITSYGASYLAGVTAAAATSRKPLIVQGNEIDSSTYCAIAGFSDGYCSVVSADSVDKIVLADDWAGYTMAAEVYANMSEWVKSYGFIYPIAGGSNHGIYRYLREYSADVYTTGYDTDCSHLSTQVVGSTVKHIDALIAMFVARWIESGTMPEQSVYGLESGYVEWELAPGYEADYSSLVEAKWSMAVQMEKIYDDAL